MSYVCGWLQTWDYSFLVAAVLFICNRNVTRQKITWITNRKYSQSVWKCVLLILFPWDFLGLSEEWRQIITSIHGTTSFIILNSNTCNHSYSKIHQLSLENIDCTQISHFINLSFGVSGRNFKVEGLEKRSHIFVDIAVWRSNRPWAGLNDFFSQNLNDKKNNTWHNDKNSEHKPNKS